MSEALPETVHSMPEPDFTVCGTPMIELRGSDRLDEYVETAALKSLENPTVDIAVCYFPGETLLSQYRTWVDRQRKHLAAWRTKQPDRSGTLKLRTETVVKAGENVKLYAFISYRPAKVKVPRSEHRPVIEVEAS